MSVSPRFFLLRSTALVLLLLLPQAAHALLNIDGTRNQVFVFGNISFGWDSNIFSQKDGAGDYTVTANAGIELKRRAGIIAVNSRLTLDYMGFQEFRDQSAWNPSFYIEFNKTTGRTTGAFTVNAFRSNKADSAVNLRTSSWNFPLGLNIKYPINDNYYITSTTNYLNRRYTDNNSLSNYIDIAESIDLFYVWTSKLDLFAGYRIRYAETSLGNTTDHGISLGATGGLFSKVNGTIRTYYQIRQIHYTGETFDQIGAAATLTWNATRKFTLGAQVVRDFNTAATGVTVDSLSAQLNAYYTFTRQFQANAGVGYGRNKFLGKNQIPRRDDFFTWDIGATYSWSEHLRVNASYSYMHNWSSLTFSDFERHGYSLNISSRY